jgi:hypothetical protein
MDFLELPWEQVKSLFLTMFISIICYIYTTHTYR